MRDRQDDCDMSKRALVTGITGQDGAYLTALLLEKGYEVFGGYRRLSTPNFWRLQSLGVFDKVSLIPIDLADTTSIMEAIKVTEPDEIYNLAAQSFVEASFEQPVATANVSGVAVTRFLEAVRQIKPGTKFYQASSSEMFGLTGNSNKALSEKDILNPASPYAAAKVYAHSLTTIYRSAYGMITCSGILFNHESPLRGMEFVTRKISNGVAKIKLALDKELVLGNLETRRDWGYAPEYVEAMWLMLQQHEPNDYVVATGRACRVKDFAEKAFNAVGLDWQNYVRTDQRYLRPLDVECLIGDASKAQAELGWSQKTDVEKLVEIMVKTDLERWQDWLAGKRFAWDAPNYPSELRILTRGLGM
jgi:GDPmannose 4,6-dehydratase